MGHIGHTGHAMENEDQNIYLKIPIERVRQDAANGVSLAKQAWRIREPDLARAAGIGIEPSQQAKILRCVKGFYQGRRAKQKVKDVKSCRGLFDKRGSSPGILPDG